MRRPIFGLLVLLVPLIGQTTHEGETGGKYNTVTVYTQSHVHIDKGLVEAAGLNLGPGGVTIKDNEIIRHGHEGPRILRVLLPELDKGDYRRGLRGTTINEADVVEIELLDRTNNGTLGLLKLSRADKATDPRGEQFGFLTAGHTLGKDKISLQACAQACEAGPTIRPEGACAQQAANLKAELVSSNEPISTWLWIFTFDPQQPLQWVAKTPSMTAMRQIIVDKVPEKIKFEFSLVKTVTGKPEGDPNALGMKVLRVKRGPAGGENFEMPMPLGARFQVCDYDEKTGKSKCDPVPACQGFWQRHFNSTCRLYGGEGVFTGRHRQHESKEHQHR